MTFTASAKVVLKRQPKRITTESLTRLRPPSHSCVKVNRNENSDGSPCGSCTLLGYALMQIPKSTEIGAAKDKATLPPQYLFHQRWKNP
jgi:hypothetical protein